MRRAWAVWRTVCAALVSTAIVLVTILAAWTWIDAAATQPISVSISPDKQFSVRVFSAGQGSIPPDYRAGVRFILRRRNGWFWSRDMLVAQAPFADGWAVRWTGSRALSIEAGPLSWFSPSRQAVGGVNIQLDIRRHSPGEARCIDQALTSAINGIVCFDALIGAAQPTDHPKPAQP